MHQISAIFRGNVQGVGFRATARQIALKLGLVGIACNLPNGDVELIAQGEKESLDELLKLLQQHFAIDHVKVKHSQVEKSYSEFRID